MVILIQSLCFFWLFQCFLTACQTQLGVYSSDIFHDQAIFGAGLRFYLAARKAEPLMSMQEQPSFLSGRHRQQWRSLIVLEISLISAIGGPAAVVEVRKL